MSPTLIGIIGIIIMLLMFLTQMPVAFVMALVGYVGFSYVINIEAGLALLALEVYETLASYDLSTIAVHSDGAAGVSFGHQQTAV